MKKNKNFSKLLTLLIVSGLLISNFAFQESLFAQTTAPASMSIPSNIDVTNYNLWYSDYIKSIKVGYSNDSRVFTTYQGRSAVLTKSSSMMSIKRLDSVINYKEEMECYETPDGSPIRYKQTSYEGDKLDKVVEAIARDGYIEIFTTNRGSVTPSSVKLKTSVGDLKLQYGADKLFAQNAKTSFEYETIIPSLSQKIFKVTAQYVDTEEVSLLRDKKMLNKYKIILDQYPEMENYEWRDNNGVTYKTTSSFINLSRFLTNEKEAKLITADKSVDIVADFFVNVKKAIPDPTELTNATYTIRLKEGQLKNIFVFDERQRAQKYSPEEMELSVKAYKPTLLTALIPFNLARFAPYLKDSDYIQPEAPKVRVAAKEAMGNERNAFLVAKILEKWVNKNITKKNYDTGMATASEIMETKSGDCSEHAILLASMLRSVGIPAQIISGLVYIPLPGSDQGAFGYHMWVEAYVGEWIQLDATRPNDSVADATHLAMNKSAFNTTQEMNTVNDLVMKAIGNIEIDVTSYASSKSGFYDVKRQATENLKPIDISELSLNPYTNTAYSPFQTVNLDKYKADTDKMITRYNISNKPNTDPVLESSEGQFTKGMANFAKGDIEKAIKNFNKSASMIAQTDAKKHYDMGVRLIGVMMFSLAQKELEITVALNNEIWSPKAQSYLDNNMPKGNYTPDAEINNMTGFSFANFTNNYPAAILMYQKAIDNSPDFSSPYYNIAYTYLLQGEYDSALTNYNNAIRLNSSNFLAYAGIGTVYEQTGKTTEAINNYERAISLGKSDPNIVKNLRFKVAALKASQMVAANPKNPHAYIMVGNAALDTEQYQQASKAFIKALSINPKIAEGHVGLGKAFSRLGKALKAENEFQKALKLNSKEKEAYAGLAIINKKRLNYAQATSYIKKALALSPNNNDYLIESGDIYLEQEKYDLALNEYSKVNNALGLYKMGLTYNLKKQPAQAIACLERSAKANPFDARPYNELAKIYMKEDNIVMARNYVDNALALDNNYADAYYVLGLIEEHENDKVNAAVNFVNSFTIQPTSVDAYNHALKLYQDLDMAKAFPLPRPKYIPKREERNYIIKLLYFDALVTDAAIKYYTQILQNCPMGTNVIGGDLTGAAVLKQVMSNNINNLKFLYNQMYYKLEPPPSLSQLHIAYLDKLWSSIDYRYKDMMNIDYMLTEPTDEIQEEDATRMKDAVNAAKDDADAKTGNYMSMIGSISRAWDPITLDEIFDASGYDPKLIEQMAQKALEVDNRNKESLEEYLSAKAAVEAAENAEGSEEQGQNQEQNQGQNQEQGDTATKSR